MLGFGYHLVMSLIAVFCTNSINILAGINGLEVSQSIIIACFVIIHNIIQLQFIPQTSPEACYLSLFLTAPFLATSVALFYYNK
jgi:UDP-N-acetylglucosamine--dolichyl-phosphate N-acetylglucosaminephosphotransferase